MKLKEIVVVVVFVSDSSTHWVVRVSLPYVKPAPPPCTLLQINQFLLVSPQVCSSYVGCRFSLPISWTPTARVARFPQRCITLSPGWAMWTAQWIPSFTPPLMWSSERHSLRFCTAKMQQNAWIIPGEVSAGKRRLLRHIPHPVKEKRTTGPNSDLELLFFLRSDGAKWLNNWQRLFAEGTAALDVKCLVEFLFPTCWMYNEKMSVTKTRSMEKTKKKCNVVLWNRCACHVQSHLCIPHTCKCLFIVCVL